MTREIGGDGELCNGRAQVRPGTVNAEEKADLNSATGRVSGV